MKSIQVNAKSVQKAIEQGLKELNVAQEDVSIKILDEGGLFRRAKVELILDKEEEIVLTDDNKINQPEKAEEIKIKKEEPQENILVNKEKNLTQETVSFEEKSNENTIKKSAEEVGKIFLEGLFKYMGIEATVETYKSEVGLTFNASGDKVGNLIGKRGETLNAIQEILSNVIKKAGIKEQKVFFDVENYKNRREISLINLAERMASKAIKINKPIKLEKMSAYERKIIHTAIQDIEGVTSKSEGEEPNRHLIIIPTNK